MLKICVFPAGVLDAECGITFRTSLERKKERFSGNRTSCSVESVVSVYTYFSNNNSGKNIAVEDLRLHYSFFSPTIRLTELYHRGLIFHCDFLFHGLQIVYL